MPHPVLPSANWADSYTIEVPSGELTAGQAARMVVDATPSWIAPLMRTRDAVVGRLGLKRSTDHHPGDMEMIGVFPIVERSDDRVVLGFDDRHLDFRVVVDVRHPLPDRSVVSMTTLVNRKILFGKIYIAVITPFHKLLVRSALSAAGDRLARHITGVAL
jgi:hypothetical protein